MIMLSLLALLFIPFVVSEPILVLQADLSGQNPEMTSVAVLDGKPTPPSSQGTYTITLFTSEGRKLYDTHTFMEKGLYQKLPYSPETAVITVSKGDKGILTHTLSFCNSDGLCDGDENHLTCPSDCSMEQKDTLCLPYADSVCDPDCQNQEDTDCTALPPPTLPEKPLTAHPAVILVLVALLGLLLLYYIRLERRRQTPQQPPSSYQSNPYYQNYYQNTYTRK